MDTLNWNHYILLWGGAVFGAIAILPYAFELNKDKLAEVTIPKSRLMLLSVIQGAVIFAILTLLGLLATQAIGLSIMSSWGNLLVAILAGIFASSLLVAIEVIIFRPHLPPALQDTNHDIALWKRLLACFYGGISEEIMTRLFLVSGITWLLTQVTQSTVQTWVGVAIFLSALLFGLGHLPATSAITKLTPLIIIRAIVLNGVAGLVFGWVFLTYGFIAAMIAHFSADIVLHVITPTFLKAPKSEHNMTSIQPI